MFFENSDPAKMLIDFNRIKTYKLGGSLTLEELKGVFGYLEPSIVRELKS